MKITRFWTLPGLLALLSLACNLPNLFAAATPDTDEVPAQSEPLSQVIEPSLDAQETLPSDPQSAAESCLNTTWVINNLSSYITTAIPAELMEEYNLVYKETSGQASLTLAPDGRISMIFDGIIILFDANVSLFTVPLTVGIDGEASGVYSVSGDTLTTSQMDTSRIDAVAQALGQDVVDPAQIISLIPLVQAPFDSAVYTCSGNTLQLQFPAFPSDFPPLVFLRVQ